MSQKQKSELKYTGNIQEQTGAKESVKVGTIRLFQINSSNKKAPILSGEVRVLNRIYRVALWDADKKED